MLFFKRIVKKELSSWLKRDRLMSLSDYVKENESILVRNAHFIFRRLLKSITICQVKL